MAVLGHVDRQGGVLHDLGSIKLPVSMLFNTISSVNEGVCRRSEEINFLDAIRESSEEWDMSMRRIDATVAER